MSKSLKFLVVDDEFLIRRALSLAGQSQGHIVKEAENGKEALKLWSSFEPDLAFIDILMPEMDGFQLLEKIPKDSKTKLIIISAHDDLKEREIKNKWVELFIQKPFESIFQVIETAEELFQNKKLLEKDKF